MSSSSPKPTPKAKPVNKRSHHTPNAVASSSGEKGIIRCGAASVKGSWMWKSRWLVLKELTLTIQKSENSPQQSTIYLRDITALERTDLKRHCLLLSTNTDKRFFLSLTSDAELYDWQDDIYQRSPLSGVSKPTDFVHKVHAGFDPVSGAFTGLPKEWNDMLSKSGLTPNETQFVNLYTDRQEKGAPAVPIASTSAKSLPGRVDSKSSVRLDSKKKQKVSSSQAPSSSKALSSSQAPRLDVVQLPANTAVRSGMMSVKEDKTFGSWKGKWVVLGESTLTMHKSEDSPQHSTIHLRDVSAIERTDLKPFCLLLSTKDKKRFFLSLESDKYLYDWQDDIYQRSPLLNGVGNPTGFKHDVHVGFDPLTGAFVGLPTQWKDALSNPSGTAGKSAALGSLVAFSDQHASTGGQNQHASMGAQNQNQNRGVSAIRA